MTAYLQVEGVCLLEEGGYLLEVAGYLLEVAVNHWVKCVEFYSECHAASEAVK